MALRGGDVGECALVSYRGVSVVVVTRCGQPLIWNVSSIGGGWVLGDQPDSAVPW